MSKRAHWNNAKHEPQRCACGDWITRPHRPRHKVGWWHRHHLEVRRLLGRGLSCAEIGRQLGVGRAYVHRKIFTGGR